VAVAAGKIIIPLGPGGGGDVFTRLMAESCRSVSASPSSSRTGPVAAQHRSRACAEAPPGLYVLRAVRELVSTTSSPSKACVQSGEGFEPVVNLFISPTRWW
jgi:hypothetical protein